MSSKLAFLLRILVFCNFLAIFWPELSCGSKPASHPHAGLHAQGHREHRSRVRKTAFDAGQRAQPPITDTFNGFAWPDTPMGVLKTANGYEFFASDGGAHYRQLWQGVNTLATTSPDRLSPRLGTLDNPLGSGDPQDVSVSPNPDPAVNPNYPSYGYMGGGPVFQVPAGMPGAGNLLVTYHAELPNDALYAALGLAASSDNGLHWTDLGEIIRLNQAYAVGLDGFEIGDGPLVLSPDGKYFYLYFPDWIANGYASYHRCE